MNDLIPSITKIEDSILSQFISKEDEDNFDLVEHNLEPISDNNNSAESPAENPEDKEVVLNTEVDLPNTEVEEFELQSRPKTKEVIEAPVGPSYIKYPKFWHSTENPDCIIL